MSFLTAVKKLHEVNWHVSLREREVISLRVANEIYRRENLIKAAHTMIC